MPRPPTHTAAFTLLAAALAVPGCQRTLVDQTLDTNYASDDVAADLAFTHALPLQSAVANDEGLHAVIVFALDEDPARNYEDRVALAKERQWLPQDFSEPANMAMQRGTLARMLVQIMQVRGGLMMRLVGPIPRYATRELVDAEVFSSGSTENQTITGLELIGALGKARDHIDEREAKAAARAAPPPPASAPPVPAQPDEPAPEAAPDPARQAESGSGFVSF